MRRFTCSDQRQLIEEYVGNSTTPEVRYWYGIRDINDIVRRQFIDPDDPTDLYALRDTMNVVALVNASGVVQQRMACDTFGNTRSLTTAFAAGSNAAGWNLLFHGHDRDADTGLSQLRIGCCHPNLGVWLSRDPIRERGGINFYLSSEANLLNVTDFNGMLPFHLNANVRQSASFDCGAYFYRITFSLTGEYHGEAHLYQKVGYSLKIDDCPGSANLTKIPAAQHRQVFNKLFGGGSMYYEVWPKNLRGNHREFDLLEDLNSTMERPNADGGVRAVVVAPRFPCTKGTLTVSFKAVVHAGPISGVHYDPILRAPGSGTLPNSTRTGRVGKQLSNEIRRKITASWNCCGGNRRTTVVHEYT